MRLHTPEISWHGKEPVFSVDFSKVGPKWRLATAGADTDIKLWSVTFQNEGKPNVEFRASLNRHTKAVNVVRFSSNEDILASGSDDNFVIIWKLSMVQDEVAGNLLKDTDEAENKENWTVAKMLRGHIEDVYDLAWSPDGTQLISGSVDNSAIIWDVVKGQKLVIFKDHKHYVQGVTWDPLGQYLATLSTDRSCRLYSTSGNYRCCYNINKLSHPGTKTGENGENLIRSSRMFHDETLTTFFRRLSYTPDGSLLIVPTGLMDINDQNVNTSYIFTRGCPNKPAVCLPSPHKATIAIRCCPLLFELQTDGDNDKENEESKKSLFKLPYRMVFAVATLDSVLLYDTQQKTPFGYVGNIHYAALTDITWSSDGRLLVVSSSDGYCSLVRFAEEELGKLYRLSVKEVLEKPAWSSSVKNMSSTPKVANDPGLKSNKRTSPGGTDKQGTPNGTRKKEPKRILPYTVPISSPNTPAGKVGQPTPRRVQVTSLSPPSERTGESDNRSATHPLRDTVVPRRVQVTTLSSDVGKSIPSPQQRIDRTTPTQSSVQGTVKPRRIQPIPVPCDSVAPILAVKDGVSSSSSVAPTKESKQNSEAPTNKSSSMSTKKPRHVTTTLLSESCCEKKSTSTTNCTSSKTINTSIKSTERKTPRRVLVTRVVENEPSSQNMDNREDTTVGTTEKSILNGTCSTDYQLIKGDEDASVSQRDTVKTVSSENSPASLVHEIPAVQNMNNLESEQVMGQTAALKVHEQPYATSQPEQGVKQGVVKQSQAAQHLTHEENHKPPASQQPKGEQQPIQEKVQLSQAPQPLTQEVAQQTQVAHQFSETKPEEASRSIAVHQELGSEKNSIPSGDSTTAESSDKSVSRSGNKRPYPLEPEVIILNE